MRLKKLHLLNFKNYPSAELELEGSIHCFLGRNGSGKTNLLESIHYLSLSRGLNAAPDAAKVRLGEEHFLVRGAFEHEGRQKEITCSFTPERKKKMAEDGKEYSRFSDHIGRYPLVIVTPADIELVWDGDEVKRKYFDTMLSQLGRDYLEQLIIYQANLRQRNGLLKMVAEGRSIDRTLLATYDDRLVAAGTFIHDRRKAFVQQLAPIVQKHYRFLVANTAENPDIIYASELDENSFAEELNKRIERDILLGRTTLGIHRDEFQFTLGGQELKTFGSQGQQKSFLIALKLAEFDCLAEKNKFKPLLLLDDIFDKLDDERILQLMKLVAGGSFGQIFMTDARPGRSLEVLAKAGVTAQCFEVMNDQVLPWRD